MERKIKQYGNYFVNLTSDMRTTLMGLIWECEDIVKQKDTFVYLDSVYMSAYDVFKLCKEFRLALITGRIAVDLMPLRLVAGSKRCRAFQRMINDKEREKWMEVREA